MKITFRQIDAFQTLITSGTVTKTAALLEVSQPAVSRLIADLEKTAGFKLFNRSGRELEPTLEGRLFAEEVAQSMSGLKRIEQAAQNIRDFNHVKLRLVSTPPFASTLAPVLIKKFSKRHPNVHVCLEVQSDDERIEWMVLKNQDFGVAVSTGRNRNIAAHELLCTEAVCILPVSHRLAGNKSVSPEDLVGEIFVSYFEGSLFKSDIDKAFNVAKVRRLTRYEGKTTGAIIGMVGAGLGVSIISSGFGAGSFDQRCTTVPFIPQISYTAELLWSTQRGLSTIQSEFLDMVRDEFQDPSS
ncbi:MAG: LysR substrate-binding domain-containing protein [Candidatus Puniceispirillaceae bacterium]